MPASPDIAYRHIKDEILRSRLRPGEMLSSLQIASVLGLSRTPVREALNRLQQEGLVRRKGSWGYAVRAMDLPELLGLYRVREVLEVEAALEAVDQLTESDFVAMKKLLDRAARLLERRGYPEFLRVNREFRGLMVKATGNAILEEILAGISERIQISGLVLIERYPQRAVDILEGNRRIFDALKSRRRTAIRAAVRQHVRRGSDVVRQILGTGTLRPEPLRRKQAS